MILRLSTEKMSVAAVPVLLARYSYRIRRESEVHTDKIIVLTIKILRNEH